MTNLKFKQMLLTMDVPINRLTDYRWLIRNLPIRNSNHPQIEIAMEFIRTKIQKNEIQKNTRENS